MLSFGKLPKRTDEHKRTLQLANYLTPELPQAPAKTGNLARVYAATHPSGPLFPMDGNDTKGDCTIAALAHFATMAAAFTGKTAIPTQAAVEALYFHLTGGADTGLDLLTVLKYIRKNEWLGQPPILGFAEVTLRNRPLARQAINAFGFLYTGFVVTDKTISQFDAGQPWTKGVLQPDGHAVVLADYDTATGLIQALTWGSTESATWPWYGQCADESYVVLPAEAATPGYIPGLDIQHLLADLAAVTA